MLSFRNLELYRGDKRLFSQLNVTLYYGQKIGIIGRNGCGKSSLFSLILGNLTADAGQFEITQQASIAHVQQETASSERNIVDYVIDGDCKLREMEQHLRQAEAANQGELIAQYHTQLEQMDAFTVAARAAQILRGLGFVQSDHDKTVRTFSGGWRMRLNIAQALICRSDILLLDEPTNHLDLDTVIWLEDWIKRYPGTLLLISHDRIFLDNTVRHVLYFHNQLVTLFSGNFSAFEKQQIEILRQQQIHFDKQQEHKAKLEKFIQRFRAKATKAKQAQSRIKVLEKLEEISVAHAQSPLNFEFPEPKHAPNPVMQLESLNVGYEQTPVLRNINLAFQAGSRIGLLGRNGAGKSTFIKALAQEIPTLSGGMLVSTNAKIGYFAQHQIEQLNLAQSPLYHLLQLTPLERQQNLRNFLGGFGFSGEFATTSIENFSGGEKARLALALIVWQAPNMLLLDEPTNHLDMDMRHALTMALQSFQGALVIVSHDRHLLSATTDEFLLVHDGSVSPFDGDLTDYQAWLTNEKIPEKREKNDQNRKSKRRAEAERRAQKGPLQNKLKTTERQMDSVTKELEKLQQQLTDPQLYVDTQKQQLQTMLLRQAELDKKNKSLEEDWLSLSEQLEELTVV